MAAAESGSMFLSVLSPERRLVDRVPVTAVTLAGSEGEIQILPGHSAMVGTLETGILTYVAAGGNPESGVVSSGFFKVSGDDVTVIAETLELKSEINVTRARDAQKKAEAVLQEAGIDPEKFRKYELKLQRSLLRQQFAGRA